VIDNEPGTSIADHVQAIQRCLHKTHRYSA
jgi:hypothetical protein